jgi:hypothetical protein
MTETETRAMGLLLRKTGNHGALYIECLLVCRERGSDAPLGVSSKYTWPKWLADYELDGLGMYGFVSDVRDDDGKCRFIGDSVEYRNVYSIDETKARAMAKTLRRIYARAERAKAYEPGDKLISLAAALKLDFVVEDRAQFKHDPDRRWLWLTVPEGKNRYRQLIAEAEQERTAELGPKAVAR